jgi:tRNA(Ile)-lysidine synthase
MTNDACALRIGVRRCLTELPAESTGVVALSGGPDSVALLRALVMEMTTPLVIAHLNHQLRGEESDADEAFVRQLYEGLVASGARLLPLRCQRLDVRAAAVGDNLESVARRLRYDWLTTVARETGAAWVATGHTADDQAETVLHRLLRGTGFRGLSGIPRTRELAPGIAVVRPFLDIRRDEVLAFLRQLDQPYSQDSTNFDRQFTRNRLRHELLPLLATEFNPAAVDVLCRLAVQASEVQAYLGQQAATLLAVVELPRAGAMVVLDGCRLAAEPPVLVREVLRMIWERERWPLGEMGFADWQRVTQVVLGEQPTADLPGRVRVLRNGKVVQIRQVLSNSGERLST